MKRSIFSYLTILLLIISTNSIAQKEKKKSSDSGSDGYKTGIGLRGGNEGGLTIKHFIKEGAAIEGIFTTGLNYNGYGNRSFRITGLYEIQKPLPNASGFNYFYGVGAHLGSYSYYSYGYVANTGGGYYDKNNNWHKGNYKENYISIGLDAIVGLEYQFTELPFTVGLDLKPYFDVINGRGSYFDFALSLRYVIK